MILTTTNRLQAPAATVLHVAGDVDTFATDDLREQLRRLPLGADDAVVVDLSAVTFMSCTALRVLAEAQTRLGSRLRLGGRSRVVIRLLEITELTSFFAAPARAGSAPAKAGPGPAASYDAADCTVPPAHRTGGGTWTFSRTDLERVRGLLMGVHGCDAEAAWRMLTSAAARYGVPVGELVDLLIGGRRNGVAAPSSAAAVAALTVLMRRPDEEAAAAGDPAGADIATGPPRTAVGLANP